MSSSSSVTSREVALAIIPKITGGLSMIGSGWIAYQVLSDAKKRHKTYHRLVAMMSVCDVVSSFGFFLSTWPIPPGVNQGWDSPYHYEAYGNEGTCTAQGWAIQFGLTTVFFNIMLAIHYLLVIKHNYTETALQQKERYMWSTALVFGLTLSVPGLILRMYNNSNLWCWISPNWNVCGQEGLSRDECVQQTYQRRWIFYYGPLWASIAVITIAQMCLWWTVRQMELKVAKWRLPGDSKAARMRQSRRVALQAAWYVAVFIICWLPYTAIAMTGRYFNPHDTPGFVVLLTVVICQPAQGILNVFVYHRQSLARSASTTASVASKRLSTMIVNRFGSKKEDNNNKQGGILQQQLERLREELKDVPLTTTDAAGPSSTTEIGTSRQEEDNFEDDIECPVEDSNAENASSEDCNNHDIGNDNSSPQGSFVDEEAGEPVEEEEQPNHRDSSGDLHAIYD